jgi:histidinol-phosphate aminotransferase
MRYDLPAMLKAVNEKTRIVFLANPNNPTGDMVKRSELREFLKDLPRAVTLLIDEAYYEFAADDSEYPSSLEFIAAGFNVVGLRTFSKAYGLAGIRLGYGFAPPKVADAVNRAREPFNVNSLAQIAGIAALSDDEHVRRTVRMNHEEIKVVAKHLAEHGVKVYPSWANFVFADFGRPSRPIYDALLEQGIIVRPGEAFGKPTFLRISIGTPDENRALGRALGRAVAAVV